METTLTINIPPPERVRAAKGERLKKEKNEAVQGSPNKGKEKDREEEKVKREKEKDEEKERRKEEKEKELREREKLERERRVSSSPWSFSETVHSKNHPPGACGERNLVQGEVCYDHSFSLGYTEFLFVRFQKMREKYDKATNVSPFSVCHAKLCEHSALSPTQSHEIHLRELEVLNAKLKNVQAENEWVLLAHSGTANNRLFCVCYAVCFWMLCFSQTPPSMIVTFFLEPS